MDTAAHWIRTIRRQSEWKVQLVHFAQSPHLWCVSLAAICQLGCDMSAQLSDDGSGAFVSSDITCQLSCSSSQLQHVSSAAFYTSDDNLSAVFGRPISWLQSIKFGCNVWVFRLSSNTDCQLGCDPQNLNSAASTSRVAHDQLLCTMWALGAICQLCKCHVSSAAMLQLKCNRSLCPSNDSFWLKSVIPDANKVCLGTILLSCGNPAQLQSEKGYVVSVAAGVSNDAEVMIGMKLMIQHKSSPA